jgi:hypothetical protein
MLLTKSFILGTRQLIIFNIQANKSNNLHIALLGTNDCINYTLVKNIYSFTMFSLN